MMRILFSLIFLSNALNFYAQSRVNVEQFGAIADDQRNDWVAIQKAIDFVTNNGGGEVFFPAGTYDIVDRTLLIWGSNIKLIGENRDRTILLRSGKAGWWGELISISGLVPGGKYYGGMGGTDYNRFIIYNAHRLPSKNIIVQNLTFDNKLPYPINANNIGITNSQEVLINNCILKNAPQSNIAIVNDTKKSLNKNIVLSNSIFESSSQHNVRVISYNQGTYVGNNVIIEHCVFKNIRNLDTNKEILGKKVHLWYRAGIGGPAVKLEVNNSIFDSTGMIVSTVNANNFSIKNSVIEGGISLSNNKLYLRKSKVIIEGNKFSKEFGMPRILNVGDIKLINNKID